LRYVWIGKRRDGFFHEPILGKRDDELLPAQDAAVLMEAEQSVLNTGKGQKKEVRFYKNNQLVIYVMAIEPLFDDAQGVVGLTVAVMDVTDQRRLEAERQDYAAQMELQRRLLEHSEKERIELARNLHDGPIQSLVGLGFSLQIIKDIQKADRMDGDGELHQMGVEIKNAIAELRGFCNELRPPVLSRLGLRRALLENIEEFHQRNHQPIKTSIDFPDDLKPISDPISLALYRIYQHAISDIVRHAEASEVWVRCKTDPQEILFEIHDNGKGLSGPVDWVAYARDGHLGIVGMKERAEAVGGAIQLISEPGKVHWCR
jgi:signal transduction histidine kinase